MYKCHKINSCDLLILGTIYSIIVAVAAAQFLNEYCCTKELVAHAQLSNKKKQLLQQMLDLECQINRLDNKC